MVKKDDRRIIRTKKLLRDAMLSLILERGYDDFNIQDITDLANLGRATFYLHYREKDNLLADLINHRFEEFSKATLPYEYHKDGILEEKAIEKLFYVAEENYDFYRIMEIGKGGSLASAQMQQIIRNKVKERLDQLKELAGVDFSFPQDFLETYLTGALFSLIFWWLEHDMPYSASEMAKMYSRINTHLARSYQPQVSPSTTPPEPVAEKPKPAPRKTNPGRDSQTIKGNNENTAGLS